jgi:hypothetical protein
VPLSYAIGTLADALTVHEHLNEQRTLTVRVVDRIVLSLLQSRRSIGIELKVLVVGKTSRLTRLESVVRSSCIVLLRGVYVRRGVLLPLSSRRSSRKRLALVRLPVMFLDIGAKISMTGLR